MRWIIMVMSMAAICTATAKEVIRLTPEQAEYLAKKVWQNEGAGKDKYLIWWNEGEDFASLGIGHFIWFPKNHTERFREVFPMVVAYMQKRGVAMPKWLTPQSDLPWDSKMAMFAAKKAKTKRYVELFRFLQRTKRYQAQFMAERMVNALPQMLATLHDTKQKAQIRRRFERMLYKEDGTIDARGLYILIDYTNFKGEGTLPTERYKGQGWGLLQVLEHMDENEPNKYKAFSNSAKAMLDRRIKNSPPERGEIRWRKGWFKRLDSYWK